MIWSSQVNDTVGHWVELNLLDDTVEGLTFHLQRDAEDVRINNELGDVQLFYRKVLLLTASIEHTGTRLFLRIGWHLSFLRSRKGRSMMQFSWLMN